MQKGKRGKGRRGVRKNRVNRRRGFRPVRSVPDIAKLSESTPFSTPLIAANTMYMKRDFSIDVNPRSRAVANAYQHYRVKKITLKIKPLVDTFTGGVGFTAPYLYYMIDKSGSLPDTITLGAMKSMGAVPHRLDENDFTISWRPSVLTQTADLAAAGGDSFSQYKISPWLSTNANALQTGTSWVCSSIDHLGIFLYVETPAGVSSLNFSVEAIMDIEYKKPLNSSLTEPGPQAISL